MGEHKVTMKAETAVMQLQAREGQRLYRTQDSPTGFRKSMVLILDF